MALHTGVTEERGDDYVGPMLNRVARLLSTGHGGQVLLSQATQQLLRGSLPPGVTLRDMGEHRLKDLIQPERIYQVVAEGLPSEFPTLRTLEGHPNNLPLQSTPFIGREKEVQGVRSSLLRPEVRLLTLTGSGGIGKTRLALQAAAEMLHEFKDGVFFVQLTPIIDPGLVLSTVAYTLGLREAEGQPIADTLKEYLKDKQLLLVLDNFEQVAEAAPQVADLLKSAPQLEVLVTSRAAMGLYVEHQYAVPPLHVPDHRRLPNLETLPQYEAVELFIQRAEAVKPGFQVNNANAPAVAEICYRLEGIPLAIELAAARSKTLPPQALLAKLGSRLKLLTGGAKDLHARHQTLRNTVEWSYDLLTKGEQQLLRRMAVFRGGRTLEAAEEVCNANSDCDIDVLDGVTSLVDKSLIYTTEESNRVGGEPRYLMLETIYEYAWEKLVESGEAEGLQRQHARYFMALAEKAEPQLSGGEQAEWLARLEDEHDNIRAALRWAKEQREHRQSTQSGNGTNSKGAAATETAEIAVRLAGAIWRFWYVRGYFTEGREQLAGALLGLLEVEAASSGQLPPPLRAYKAKALNGAGVLTVLQADYASARALFEESLALRREIGDKLSTADTLDNLAILTTEQGDHAAARPLFEENLRLRRELKDKWGIAASLSNLGNWFYSQGEHASARSLYEESLALQRELKDKWGIAASLSNLGIVATGLNDYQGARALFEESLALQRELGHKRGIAASLAGLGGMIVDSAASTSSTERGAKLLGAVEGLLESIDAVMDVDQRIPYERSVATARAKLGEDAFKRAWREGRAMRMEQAVAYALAEEKADK
jgi:predicted ATPase